MVRLSESELQNLAKNTQKQQSNVEDVRRAGESAVRMADSDWKSSAFESFKARWQRDGRELNQLAEQLADWQKKCTQNSQVANRVNKPFN
jgi:hypothetical protein